MSHLPTRKAILERRTFEPQGESRGQKVRLDFNENTAGCSRAAIRALRKLSAKELATYPEYQPSTKKMARHFGVKAEELLLANGGDDALRTFFDAFVEQGSKILICEPTFPMYRYYAEIYGAQVDALRYGSEMEFPLEEVIAGLAEQPRVLFIANPNNPTGTLVSRAGIKSILEAASHTAVVIDEAYAEYSGLTVVPWIRRHANLFVLRTLSKAAGLAALRLGLVMAQPESLSILRGTLPPFPVNLVALAAGEAVLEDKRTMRKHVEQVKKVREWFREKLQKLGVKVYPGDGNFLLANFGARGRKVFSGLQRHGILIRERPDVGEGFARMTIGTPKEMDLVVKLIRKLV